MVMNTKPKALYQQSVEGFSARFFLKLSPSPPSLSLAGTSGEIKQAGFLAQAHRLLYAFPGSLPSGLNVEGLPFYSGGTAPDSNRLPFFSSALESSPLQSFYPHPFLTPFFKAPKQNCLSHIKFWLILSQTSFLRQLFFYYFSHLLLYKLFVNLYYSLMKILKRIIRFYR